MREVEAAWARAEAEAAAVVIQAVHRGNVARESLMPPLPPQPQPRPRPASTSRPGPPRLLDFTRGPTARAVLARPPACDAALSSGSGSAD